MSIVHGVNLSTFVRKVRVALAEKGIDYELNPIQAMSGKSPELLAMNPLGKIPVYEVDGIAIPDSSVIIAYLERTHPERPLYPQDNEQFARALFLEEYADTRLREAISPFFYENTIKRRFMKRQPDQEVLKKAGELLNECFDYLETCLNDSKFIVGDSLSVADISIGSQIVTLQEGGKTIDSTRWPKLSRYATSLLERPSFKDLVDEEAGSLGK